jgi:hypothetical protein
MNKEEEEAPLEDPHVWWNHLAKERPALDFKKKKWFKEAEGTSQCPKVTNILIYNILSVYLSSRPPWG